MYTGCFCICFGHFFVFVLGTFEFRLRSSWVGSRCNSHTRDHSARSPPILCRWGGQPDEDSDFCKRCQGQWVAACKVRLGPCLESGHLFGVDVDPGAFILSVTETAPPGALLVYTPKIHSQHNYKIVINFCTTFLHWNYVNLSWPPFIILQDHSVHLLLWILTVANCHSLKEKNARIGNASRRHNLL